MPKVPVYRSNITSTQGLPTSSGTPTVSSPEEIGLMNEFVDISIFNSAVQLGDSLIQFQRNQILEQTQKDDAVIRNKMNQFENEFREYSDVNIHGAQGEAGTQVYENSKKYFQDKQKEYLKGLKPRQQEKFRAVYGEFANRQLNNIITVDRQKTNQFETQTRLDQNRIKLDMAIASGKDDDIKEWIHTGHNVKSETKKYDPMASQIKVNGEVRSYLDDGFSKIISARLKDNKPEQAELLFSKYGENINSSTLKDNLRKNIDRSKFEKQSIEMISDKYDIEGLNEGQLVNEAYKMYPDDKSKRDYLIKLAQTEGINRKTAILGIMQSKRSADQGLTSEEIKKLSQFAPEAYKTYQKELQGTIKYDRFAESKMTNEILSVNYGSMNDTERRKAFNDIEEKINALHAPSKVKESLLSENQKKLEQDTDPTKEPDTVLNIKQKIKSFADENISTDEQDKFYSKALPLLKQIKDGNEEKWQKALDKLNTDYVIEKRKYWWDKTDKIYNLDTEDFKKATDTAIKELNPPEHLQNIKNLKLAPNKEGWYVDNGNIRTLYRPDGTIIKGRHIKPDAPQTVLSSGGNTIYLGGRPNYE